MAKFFLINFLIIGRMPRVKFNHARTMLVRMGDIDIKNGNITASNSE